MGGNHRRTKVMIKMIYLKIVLNFGCSCCLTLKLLLCYSNFRYVKIVKLD